MTPRLRLQLSHAEERCDGCDLEQAPISLRLKNMEVRLCARCVVPVIDKLEQQRAKQEKRETL